MTFNTLILILWRQFKTKWGRFLLASAGILIGVWAITLTTSVSLGLSDTIINAINSQPGARNISIAKEKSGVSSFFELKGPPTLLAFSDQDIIDLKNKHPEISTIGVDGGNQNMNFEVNLKGGEKDNKFSCKKDLKAIPGDLKMAPNPEIKQESMGKIAVSEEAIFQNCVGIGINEFIFDSVYQNNKKNWLGKTETPAIGEIVASFKANGLGDKLGARDPKELLGKEIFLETVSSPTIYKPGSEIDVTNTAFGPKEIEKPTIEKFKIVSVIDDRDNSFGAPVYYVDFSYFKKQVQLQNPAVKDSDIGYAGLTANTKDYKDVEKLTNDLKKDKIIGFSIVTSIVSGVKIAFSVLTAVLSLFGFIAFFVSIFGIIMVMSISVLERKKEIGVLKSLGAKNSDIFKIFLLESAALGVIGWVFGMIFSLLSGLIISLAFKLVIGSNKDWSKNLEQFNIDSFSPTFPIWLVLGTLLISVFFTVISGLFPAISASRQNPVDVLRSE